MVAWEDATRADVLRAIEEYDRLGPERFFSEHGFAPTSGDRCGNAVKLSAAPVLAHGVEEGRSTNEECDPAQQLQDKVGLAHWIPLSTKRAPTEAELQVVPTLG